MGYLSLKSIVVVAILFFSTYLALLFLYLYVLSENKKLKKAKGIEDLSKRTLRLIRKNNLSKHIVLEKLRFQVIKLTKMEKLVNIILVLFSFYLLSRISKFFLSRYYPNICFEFPNLNDAIMLLVFDFLVFVILWRKIFLISIRTKIEELSRLLK